MARTRVVDNAHSIAKPARLEALGRLVELERHASRARESIWSSDALDMLSFVASDAVRLKEFVNEAIEEGRW